MQADTLEVWTAGFVALAALASACAAGFSYLQVRRARKTERAQLFLSFSERYSRKEMTDAATELMKFRIQHGRHFTEVWQKMFEENTDESSVIGRHMRVIGRYFRDLMIAMEEDLIDEDIITSLCKGQTAKICYWIVIPLYDKKYIGSDFPLNQEAFLETLQLDEADMRSYEDWAKP